VVERVAEPEATLTVSSVSDSEARSCLLDAVPVILVMFRCAKSSKKVIGTCLSTSLSLLVFSEHNIAGS